MGSPLVILSDDRWDDLAEVLDPAIVNAALARAGLGGTGPARIERVHFSARRPTVLSLRVPHGRQTRTLHAEMIGPGAADHAGCEAVRLRKAGRSQLAKAAKSPVIADSQTGLVFRPPGFDARLPGLRLLHDQEAVRDLLSSLGIQRASATWAPILIAHRLGKRAVLKIDLTSQGTVFVRLAPTRTDRPFRAFERHVRIARALDGNPDVSVPSPLGFEPGLGAAVFERLPGRPPRVAGADGLGDTSATLAALDALHRLDASGLPRHGPAEEIALLDAWADPVSALRPECRSMLLNALDRVTAFLQCLDMPAPAFCHRDFHEGQVLIKGGRAGAMDFDTASASDPMIDVGNLIAHYRLQGLRTGFDVAAFVRFAELGPDLRRPDIDIARIEPWRRAALLRLACLYSLTSEPEAVIRALFEEAAE